ncbi:MAG TPA: hypothetical protein VIM39_05270 [Candidatus Limnocylindrales bacterium]
MSEMEQIFVGDHIRELQRDAAGLRMGRRGDLPAAPRRAATGPRLRVGRWLISVGEAIAGRSTDRAPADAGDRMANPV